MAAPEDDAPRPGMPQQALPQQVRRSPAPSPADRIVRQARAVDAWLADRREREQALQARSMTRDERMDLARQLDVFRQTHEAIRQRYAPDLDAEMDALRWPGVTAVVAHRHPWFVDRLALLLRGHGVTVLLSTDNGAEALGAVVAEQPDIVLVGGSLAMMHARALLAESRRYAPDALLAVQAADSHEAERLRDAADTVFLRHHPPAVVADALVALRLTALHEAGSQDLRKSLS